jgi:nitrogen regulatory protein P-II 1
MKEIKAVIGPQKLEPLREALRAIPKFPGMTVSKAEGYAAPSPITSKASIKAELTDHVHRLRIEIIVSDDLAPQVFDTLVNSVSSGSPGDSAVWMTDVERSAFVHKTV